jgi:AcrR family transcriptional regulator
MKNEPSIRQSIEERREEVLEAALREFAARGLHGGSSDSIAKQINISQPYIFKIFGTKKGLFLAAVNRVFDRILSVFRNAVGDLPPSREALFAAGDAYATLSQTELLMLLQSFAACDDPEVREVVRQRWMELHEYIKSISGTSGDAIQSFFGYGLLMTIGLAADLPASALTGE